MPTFDIRAFAAQYLADPAIPPEYRLRVLADRCAVITEKLLEDNEKFNLTAITDPTDVLYRHILDSLLCARTVANWADSAGCTRPRLIDVGSGAGFPSLPIAAAEDRVRVLALDATAKKCRHMADSADAAGLLNYASISGRAEELAQDPLHRESFDVATARAVANLPVLAELCLPFVKPGGCFIAMKGASAPEELAAAQSAIDRLGGDADAIEMREYTVPGDPNPRFFLIIPKKSPTPAEYPRQYAQIKKNPLS